MPIPVDSGLEGLQSPRGFAAALQFFAKLAVAKRAPSGRITRAVGEELLDICARARAGFGALPQALQASEPCRAALALLAVPLAAAERWDRTERPPPELGFPRRGFEALHERVRRAPAAEQLAAELARWVDVQRAFERRVSWLLNGTPKSTLEALDPIADADRIYHAVSASFRAQSRVLELLAINRVAQATATSVFFRSTKEAETNGVHRFFDTWSLLANFFEWGADSQRGREAAERMRQIHGRYYLPNSGMKYVLLETAFTWLDGVDRLGHRPLSDVERKGYFHAHVKLGMATNIAELSHDYDEMYAWYRTFNADNRKHHPLKTETFEALVGNSLMGASEPGLKALLFTASRAGMDQDYLGALGYPPPSAAEHEALRTLFSRLARALERVSGAPQLRSLQSNPARSEYTRPGQLGVRERSPHMPVVDPALPNGGFPQSQRPIQQASDVAPVDLPWVSWEEVARHAGPDSLWVVIAGEVYDLTVFAEMHPGGLPALLAVAGKDATQAFADAPHVAATQIFKLNYRIARVSAATG